MRRETIRVCVCPRVSSPQSEHDQRPSALTWHLAARRFRPTSDRPAPRATVPRAPTAEGRGRRPTPRAEAPRAPIGASRRGRAPRARPRGSTRGRGSQRPRDTPGRRTPTRGQREIALPRTTALPPRGGPRASRPTELPRGSREAPGAAHHRERAPTSSPPHGTRLVASVLGHELGARVAGRRRAQHPKALQPRRARERGAPGASTAPQGRARPRHVSVGLAGPEEHPPPEVLPRRAPRAPRRPGVPAPPARETLAHRLPERLAQRPKLDRVDRRDGQLPRVREKRPGQALCACPGGAPAGSVIRRVYSHRRSSVVVEAARKRWKRSPGRGLFGGCRSAPHTREGTHNAIPDATASERLTRYGGSIDAPARDLDRTNPRAIHGETA